jgi:hypothetical protein
MAAECFVECVVGPEPARNAWKRPAKTGNAAEVIVARDSKKRQRGFGPTPAVEAIHLV